MAKQKKKLNYSFFTTNKAFLLPLILFLVFILQGISLPFVGYNAWNFNTYSLIAHNYNKFGFIPTKFAPIISVAENIPQNPEYYLHHPQLLSVIESGIFRVLGESFVTGRLTVIIFALGSMILLYLIAKQLYSPKMATAAAAIYSLLPASVLFGRMLGQESLVLFFVLLAVFSLLMYLKFKKEKYLALLFLSIVLGTLSDWPMVYFTICLLPFMWVKKEFTLGIKLIITSITTAVLFLIYISLFNQLDNLIGAFIVRGPGALLQQPFWPLKWLLTIITRLLFYFNPIVFLVSLSSLVLIIKKLLKRRADPTDILLLCLFAFGLLHILFYPEGSFGHPYWIYYLIPSVVLLTVMLISNKKLKTVPLLFVVILSIIYLWGVNTWKIKEIRGNVFRYELATLANKYLAPYEEVIINDNSVIDQDALLYPFYHKSILFKYLSDSEFKNYNYIVYSCINTCTSNEVLNFNKKYYSKSVKLLEGEIIIYNLKKKLVAVNKKSSEADSKKLISVSNPSPRHHILRMIYDKFFTLTGAPQL